NFAAPLLALRLRITSSSALCARAIACIAAHIARTPRTAAVRRCQDRMGVIVSPPGRERRDGRPGNTTVRLDVGARPKLDVPNMRTLCALLLGLTIPVAATATQAAQTPPAQT